jgi:hypothetical protein
MIEIRDKETGEPLGTISEEQLQFLIDNLEEEYEGDRDYYINQDTLTIFEEKGIDTGLSHLLREALSTRESMEIEWSRR